MKWSIIVAAAAAAITTINNTSGLLNPNIEKYNGRRG